MNWKNIAVTVAIIAGYNFYKKSTLPGATYLP